MLCNSLKNVIRAGWKNWNVDCERVESVAEHVFGVQSLAIAMWSQYEYEIDINKVLFMLAIHELEEIIIGDLTLWDITNDEKIMRGHDAVQMILKDLLKKEEIEKLVHEFDSRQTKEAVFAYHCDKLECDIQSKLYDEGECVDLTNQDNNPIFKDKKVQELFNSGKTWSGMWLAYGRDKYGYDDNFTGVSNYVDNNGISLQRKQNNYKNL